MPKCKRTKWVFNYVYEGTFTIGFWVQVQPMFWILERKSVVKNTSLGQPLWIFDFVGLFFCFTLLYVTLSPCYCSIFKYEFSLRFIHIFMTHFNDRNIRHQLKWHSEFWWHFHTRLLQTVGNAVPGRAWHETQGCRSAHAMPANDFTLRHQLNNCFISKLVGILWINTRSCLRLFFECLRG